IEWDVFISHASEDKEGFARPLAEGLIGQGLRVWFDEFTLTTGDRLRRSIDRGLARSRFGVVILSPDFLHKDWPQKELDGLVAREVEGVKVILPVWHRISAGEIRAISPTLADRVAVSSDKGLDHVIAELRRAIPQREQSRNAIVDIDRTSVAIPSVDTQPIEDLWVTTDYPVKLGLIDKLRANGYEPNWKSANEEATLIDFEEWEYAIVQRPDGTRVRLKIHDTPSIGGYLVLLKKKKG
ncbi:MAG: toll/interleukin-1 receptor domain-containing protein, partial [Candidatus Binataceae bacterium]